MEPEVFCNPARKTDLLNGQAYGIVDEDFHLLCYRLEPPQTLGRNVPVVDQFVEEQVVLQKSHYLCVPTEKTGWVQTETTTWGRLKTTYR
jgi:hypothetical protein